MPKPSTQNETQGTFRLNRFLAHCGVASRRKAEELIADGKVLVNSVLASHPSLQVDPAKDLVKVRGKVVRMAESVTLILHKPKGVVCTRSDPQERKTVFDLVPARLQKKGVQSIGRLDFDSSGLLILTNDGALHQAMEHPSGNIDRVYQVKARGKFTPEVIKRLQAGVELEDGTASAKRVNLLRTSKDIVHLEITLTEGRNREVRRLLAAVGIETLELKRIRFGKIQLDTLPVGKSREPTFQESRYFEKIKNPTKKRR